METLDTALKLLRPNMYMASIDLTNSFYHLLVHPRHRKFLKFSCMGRKFQFTSLPMGYKDSPRLFTKLMKVPLALLWEHYGCIIICYIDDLLILGHSPSQVRSSVAYMANLLRLLVFCINFKKSELVPTTSIEFLGFVLNSVEMSITLTQAKASKIADLAREILAQPTFSIWFLAQFLGNCVASFPAVEYGPFHTKEIEGEKTWALKQNDKNFEAPMSLPERLRTVFVSCVLVER